MENDLIELIKNAQKGTKSALKDLIKHEQNNIYTTLYYLKKDNNDISDIMQDVLIKLTNKIHQLKNPSHFKTWLNQIIINSYNDYLRKNRNKNIFKPLENDEEKIDLADIKNNPQDSVLYSELDFVIKKSIDNLPIHYKIPIALREIQGMSYGEISDVTKTTIGTVKSRIARARAIIQDDIKKYIRS